MNSLSRFLIITATLAVVGTGLPSNAGKGSSGSGERLRLMVLTDVSSLTAGVREPDDGQSLIRLMLYSNELQLEGLVASSNLGHGQVTRPELIREVVDAYEKVRPNLLLHSPGYPEAEQLRAVIKRGQPVAGPRLPVSDSVGAGKDTEASEWIIRVVDRPDRRPVWVAIWGGAADLAQALWKVRETRSAAELARFVAKLRVHAINDQDSANPWLREQFPDLYYVQRGFGIRGMYRGGDRSLVGPEWVAAHARTGHGALGALYPSYNGGDIWSGKLGPVRGIKEGDSPSLLALVPNGLNVPEHPEWGGWGGRSQIVAKGRYVDAPDALPGSEADPDPRISATYRWRPAFQADFQARLDWCVQPRNVANHPPLVRVMGAVERSAKAGSRVTLEATATEPDGDTLQYEWWLYREAGTYRGLLELGQASSPRLQFRVPETTPGETLHLVLSVRDNGEPPLTRYGRVILRVKE